MTAGELREKYLEFFKSKGHIMVPSSLLVPENDSTTLFTGSGMQPMVPYLLGEKHPLGTRIVDSQKCFRAQDIEDVGDNRHTTFFEMLGNWSFGDYFKKEQIVWMFEFLTKEIGLDPKNIYVTVFRGNEELGISRDNEAVGYWKEEFAKVGIEAKDTDFPEKNGMQDGRIFYYDETKNWWSRVGVPGNMPNGEPGGPDSEMFWDFGVELMIHENSEFKKQPCHVNCDCGRFLEIGNNVFMQYVKTEKGFELLPKGNIDFGGGLERTVAAKNNDPDIFKTDLFLPIIQKIEEISGKKYGESANAYDMRVITDHFKATTFLIADGILPSNTQQGYVLRRLIRRAIRYGHMLGINENFSVKISEVVIGIYRDSYPELEKNKSLIFSELEKEENKFRKTLEHGLAEFNKLAERGITGKDAFDLYQSYGFPFEITKELAKERGLKLNEEEFAAEFKKHQELSRTASAGMFKGGLADAGEQTKKLHTATHLLQAALRQVLGTHVSQKGSNINTERLRFDFSHPEKMTPEQIKEVEDLVNIKIKANLEIRREEMTPEEAKAQGALGVFEAKYGDKVSVYSAVGFSKEICGGPHAASTGELSHFKIVKEEASSAGVRRVKAILE
ncbi:MAG: alanine--tRNA ligase [Candidatus Moranbacteria bacterium CG_4_9_14_3_um_filter_42_9]|nr:MAG: alanine--tRNA ligase [Candidatus Moranbacteria bacterium CG_4_9_14_3_um_filter_42_9]